MNFFDILVKKTEKICVFLENLRFFCDYFSKKLKNVAFLLFLSKKLKKSRIIATIFVQESCVFAHFGGKNYVFGQKKLNIVF